MTYAPSRRPRFLLGLALTSALVILAGVAVETGAQGKAPAPAGHVSFLDGRAWRSAPHVRATRLAQGAAVYVGDRVRTGTGARLELRLRDGSAVRLGPKSKMVLDAAQFTRKKERKKVTIKLLLGRVWSKVTHAIHGDDTFKVATDSAVAGVRGTSFRVNAMADKSTLVRVYSGTVAVVGIHPIYATKTPGKERKEVAGPKEISKKHWERVVTSMMSVEVSAAGVPGQPEQFKLADDLKADPDGWIAWNRARDAAWNKAHAKP